MSNKLTIIIKTFERRKSLERLLTSIIKENYLFDIIILDDSKKNYREKILKKFPKLNINYIVTEFDIGLSDGRNRLINQVKTPYFLLCDDDFEFDEKTNLKENLKIIQINDIDILAGKVRDRKELVNLYEILSAVKHPKYIYQWLLKIEKERSFNAEFIREDSNLILKIDKKPTHLKKYDIVLNFFIGNTEKIKKIGGWKKELKLGEHEEFFYRAKENGIRVYYSNTLSTLHFPIKTFKYMNYRKRAAEFQNKWLKEYGLEFIKKS